MAARTSVQLATTAWNLQQGTMAEWIGPDSIIFNIRKDNSIGFGARVVNVVTGETKEYNRPVYAFNHKRNLISSLSFGRLHNLRRGYGYTVPLIPPEEKHPSNDGVWILNLSSSEERLVLSIDNVRKYILSTSGKKDDYTGQTYSKSPPQSSKYYWWINHEMFSADGSQLAFLVRAHDRAGTETYSFSTLMMYDIASDALWRVPRVVGSHHFHGTFLLSCDGDGTFEVRFRKPVIQLPWQQGMDGHCSLSPPDEKWILTDTYPDKKGNRHLYVEERHGATKYDLGRYRALETGPTQTRCDLHPKWDRTGSYVLFDSIFASIHGSRRAVYRKRAFPASVKMPSKGRYDSPAWLSNCKHIYLDVGSNIGVQIRKFYEPEKYINARVLPLFDQHFGGPQIRRRPGAETGICVLGMEPSPHLRPRLEKLEQAYQERGWHVHIFSVAAYTEESELEFELRDGVGYSTASSLNPMLPKSYGKIHGKARVHTIDLASFINGLPGGSVKLMKLDIEGSEYKVVPKMAQTGALCRDVVEEGFVEIHKKPGQSSTDPGLAEIQAAVANARSANGPCAPTKLSPLDDESYAKDVDDNFGR
eukprot:TRINITY_DN14810_c0_g1_i1.p1 TRINITY_DN14810_c0_g1~~TRINITY_DN14810_c0_g1_i1.p1  ORF type:complete len:589 (+),score=51.90 TRINITY_DN14810_c0_g1_i1:514-2280(+)